MKRTVLIQIDPYNSITKEIDDGDENDSGRRDGESGFLIPTSYATSTNQDDLQLLHLANAASDVNPRLRACLATRFNVRHADLGDDYALPADFHAYIPDTAYSGTFQVDLPTTPQEWTMVEGDWCPSVTTASASSATASTCKTRFLARSSRLNTCRPIRGLPPASRRKLPPQTRMNGAWIAALLILGVKWRWKKERGWRIGRLTSSFTSAT